MNMNKKYNVIPFIEDFATPERGYNTNDNEEEKIRILCWNIGNPSIVRARKQVLWLKEQKFNIIILTETKESKGCDFIVNYLKRIGFYVESTTPETGEYGVILCSKIKFKLSRLNEKIKFIQSRALALELMEKTMDLTIIGIYVPSRGDNSPERVEKKRLFLHGITEALKSNSSISTLIVCGDFNILEPDHVPHYSKFDDWEYKFYTDLLDIPLNDTFRLLHPNENEYSWVGRTNDGYRYDHFFTSPDISSFVSKCYYDHEPRHRGLSDHSGLIVEFYKSIYRGERYGSQAYDI